VWIYTYLITSKVVNVTPARDAHVSRWTRYNTTW
jgi:hypothetical protein